MTEFLEHLVDALTAAPRPADVPAVPNVDRAATAIVNLIQQAPLRHTERVDLLSTFKDALPSLRANNADELVLAAASLAGAPLRIPVASGRVRISPRLGLDDPFTTLLRLDESVPDQWTLIGGLMVLVHCLENDAPITRPTEDADIAVNVFTHPRGLARLTSELRDAGFVDQTPQALPGGPQLSYRWVRDSTRIDVAVPPRANAQRETPTTVVGRPAVELPATQQALRRTERVALAVGHRRGYLRRPDLLAAIVIKSAAAAHDRRDPERHREDLVTLADILAFSGRHLDYQKQLRAKDRDRVRLGSERVTDREWRRARDPQAARAAIEALLS